MDVPSYRLAAGGGNECAALETGRNRPATDGTCAVRKLTRKPFKLDLKALHAICDANYARVLRLFPDYETCNTREFAVGNARVRLEVIERCRYTTIFRLLQDQAESRWLGRLRIEVRAYHDAGML